MRIIARGTSSIDVEDCVVERILEMYPEEALTERPVFKAAFTEGSIKFSDLKEESEKILIPWQMFLLTSDNLDNQIKHINAQRLHKVSSKLIAKRKGSGDTTSKRIVDRLIRQQNFLTATADFQSNQFCGSLKGKQAKNAVDMILSHFEIDRSRLWRFTAKGSALEYLINKVESKNINISRGVLSNKMLPHRMVVPSDVYRNTSGFAIRDDRVPFVFLPSEINPDEVESRQIYTLIYLLSIIGLDQYDYFLGKDFNAQILSAKGGASQLHAITSELLIPESEVEPFREKGFTSDLRDSLSRKFKVSPTALVVTLRKRGIISKQEYEALKPAPYARQKHQTHARSPKVTTSVEKFCGQITYGAINEAIRAKSLTSIQAQYLIWGATNKKGYRAYRNELGI